MGGSKHQIFTKKTRTQGWIVVMGLVMMTLLRTSLVFADTCLADINRDGTVDTEDLEIMQDEQDNNI
jgi:hypothetical protein